MKKTKITIATLFVLSALSIFISAPLPKVNADGDTPIGSRVTPTPCDSCRGTNSSNESEDDSDNIFTYFYEEFIKLFK